MPKDRAVTLNRRPKKAKQVTTAKAKLAELVKLKKVNAKIDAENKKSDARFNKMDKLFTARRKSEEKLGIV